MQIKLLRAKIHHATVTRTNPEYHGSITIPRRLLQASGLLPNEAVLIADSANGNRFETYIIPAAADSDAVEMNGAAALLSGVGHRVIIMSFATCELSAAPAHHARVVICNDHNQVDEVLDQPTALDERPRPVTDAEFLIDPLEEICCTARVEAPED